MGRQGTLAGSGSGCTTSGMAQVLASGFWLKTERCGTRVVRSAQWWCPQPLGTFLLQQHIRRSQRFATYLPVLPLQAAQRAGALVLVQPYLHGATPLRRLSAVRLADPTVARSLCTFWRAVVRGWREAGWLPDVGGRVSLPWELYRPLQTENVLIDAEGRCWLVDVGATATFHSARSPLGRLHAALMLRAIRSCLTRLRYCDEAPS